MNAPLAPRLLTVADLLESLGGIAPERVRYQPRPGTATLADVIAFDGLCELVDGTLVEKAMGYRESLLAAALIVALDRFVLEHRLGLVAGADGMMQLFPRLVRIPDVSFVSWARLPEQRVPDQPVPDLVPDLAVEVLSISNTAGEMARKRVEYFDAGVRLVWEVDPRARRVHVYTAPEKMTVLTETDTLDGGDVLPGFMLPLRELFARLDQVG